MKGNQDSNYGLLTSFEIRTGDSSDNSSYYTSKDEEIRYKEETMASRAFLLIETAAGKSNEVVAAIKRFEEEEVKWVGVVTGPYDVIAEIEGATLQETGELVTGKINSIPSISRVVTCLAI